MKSLPGDVRAYRRTPEFTAETVPKGLLRRHTTKPGVWGRIVVLEGALGYRILEPEPSAVELVPGRDGVVEPTVAHEVVLRGPVRFFVEFLRRPDVE